MRKTKVWESGQEAVTTGRGGDRDKLTGRNGDSEGQA